MFMKANILVYAVFCILLHTDQDFKIFFVPWLNLTDQICG
jgi:hypothetical protein